MTRTVNARLVYRDDRSMVVSVEGPDGPVDVGTTRSTGDVGRIASRGAREVFGDHDTEVAIMAGRPPWLDEGTVVRMDDSTVETGQERTHPYAQVVGFLPVGGVIVVHPESGSGIYQPEDLEPVDVRSLPEALVRAIVQRSGRETV